MQTIQLPALSKILNELAETRDGNLTIPHARIDGGPSYMPLEIEQIDTCDNVPVIAVAHWYSQNGDVMRDPEMTFQGWRALAPGRSNYIWFFRPFTYRQDALGIDQTAVWFEDGKRTRWTPRLYKDLCSFARTWDKNIRDQRFFDRLLIARMKAK